MAGAPVNVRARTAPPAPCALPHHQPGRAVQFTEWDNEAGVMATVTGLVVQHANRTITIRTDNGDKFTSCGHVAAAS
ncbi:hypothetical protein [Mycolicibacterium wolinskyi]|uniref:hypothetical protein n=1 Tax=Mycolicibacterium wolinskyi TaxID=59750 RepID=UPI00391786FE